MAEIDKVLPNVEQTINVPNPQDVEIAEQEKLAEQGKPPVDVQQNDVCQHPLLMYPLSSLFRKDEEPLV